MKTFSDFLLESTIQELRSKANAARQRGDMKTFLELQKQAAELGTGTQAKIGAVTRDKDRKKEERQNTWISGKPSKPKDTRGKSGSLENIPSDQEGEGTSVGGRFGDRRSGRSGGVQGQSRNNATARNLSHLGVRS